ncbi:MAG TPA: hypothetical protein VNU68_16745 [Verrucomicrobiae bacterium]|nr:hypothetical protein [Verrucomicrobiae bacterium]
MSLRPPIAIGLAMLCAMAPARSAELPKAAPVPASPFLPVIYKYADTLLERGRDTFGPISTGFFLSALDRTTLGLLTNRPPAPAGVRETSRAGAKNGALTCANLQHDENLLRLLFTLSELSAKPKYSNAAAAALTAFLTRTPSTNTHLLPWGEHLGWDVLRDEPAPADGARLGTHQFFRPWILWERCFDLAPAASQQVALGLREHHLNPRTGALALQADFAEHGLHDELDDPRQAGFFLRTWAIAYARTGDEQFLRACDRLLARFEKRISGPVQGAVAVSSLSLAIDCAGAAHHVPKPLSARLRTCAAQADELFCGLPHSLKESHGFIIGSNLVVSRLWSAEPGTPTTAQVALMCLSRYENGAKLLAYREFIHAAADIYRNSSPPPELDLWPGTLGHVISLQLAAWRSTARAEYLERARELGRFALDKFFDQSPLPRASTKSEHYETITGADTLALALVELHLQVLHITAVRCPSNSIDR